LFKHRDKFARNGDRVKRTLIMLICLSLALTSIPADASALRPMATATPRYKAALKEMPEDIDISKLGLVSGVTQAERSEEGWQQADRVTRSLAAIIISMRIAVYLAVSYIIFKCIRFDFYPWIASLVGGGGVLYDFTMNLLPDIGQGYADAKAREINRRAHEIHEMALIDSHAKVQAFLGVLYDAPDTEFTQAELIECAGKAASLMKLSPEDVARALESLCKNGYVIRIDGEVNIDVSSDGPAKPASAGRTENAIKATFAAESIPDIVSEVCKIETAYTRNRIFEERISGFTKTQLHVLLDNFIYYNKDLSPIPLPEQEVLYLLSKVLSTALSGRYRKDFIIELKSMLLENPATLSPKSKVLIESYITITEIDKPAIVTTVYAMRGEHIRMQDPLRKHGGEDAFRLKVQQKEDLYKVNHFADWRMIAVNDGDDRRFASQLKSSDVAGFILRESYPQYSYPSYRKDGVPKIQILELQQDTRDAIGSVKGGAIIYGMRKALADGADYIISTDQDGSISLAEEGTLLNPILAGKADASLGLRHGHPAAVVRPLPRQLKHHAYLLFTKLNIPYIAGIKDTQVGFKAFSRDLLSRILPLSAEGKFDLQFEYGGSFDVNLLGRAIKAGADIAQVPVCYFESKASKFSGIAKAIAMAKGIRSTRRYLRQWSVPILNEPAVLFVSSALPPLPGAWHMPELAAINSAA